MAVILIPLRGGPLAGREQSVPVLPDEWVRQKPTLVFDTHDLAHLPDSPPWGRQRRVIYRLTQLPEGWIYLFECDVEFDLGCG